MVEFSGNCSFDVLLILPPTFVAKLGGSPKLEGKLVAKLARRDQDWVLENTLASDMGGDNVFHEYLRPYLSAIATRRVEQEQLAKRAETARAATARAEWIRTYPAEHAAQQREAAKRTEAVLGMMARSQAELRRRQSVCEANGGIWTRRTRNGVPTGVPFCFR